MLRYFWTRSVQTKPKGRDSIEGRVRAIYTRIQPLAASILKLQADQNSSPESAERAVCWVLSKTVSKVMTITTAVLNYGPWPSACGPYFAGVRRATSTFQPHPTRFLGQQSLKLTVPHTGPSDKKPPRGSQSRIVLLSASPAGVQ